MALNRPLATHCSWSQAFSIPPTGPGNVGTVNGATPALWLVELGTAGWWKVGVPSVSCVSSVGSLRCLVGRSSLGLSPECSSVGVPLSGSVGTGISGLPVDVSWGNSGLVTGSSARVLLEGVVSGSTGIKVSSPSGSSSELSTGIVLRVDVVGGRVIFGFRLELPRGVFSGFTAKRKVITWQ